MRSRTLVGLMGFVLISLFGWTAKHFSTNYQGKLVDWLQDYSSRLQEPEPV